MAGYKETPRQKMIAMMYLVLTALLALNVSKQILDSFVLVNETIKNTNETLRAKVYTTRDKFLFQYQLNPNKVGPYWEKAQTAISISQTLINYIDSLRAVIVQKTEGLKSLKEGDTIDLKKVWKKDNYNVSTYFFVRSTTDGSAGEARILKEKIENYKKRILDLLDPKYKNSIKMGLDTKGPFYNLDGKKETWEMHNFYRTILAADVTILNKLKAEVYNTEFDAINNLMSSISAEDFKYNQVAARVIPKSGYVFLGDDYQAEIVVAAYDTKSNPNVRYVLGSDTLTTANFKSGTLLEGSNGVVTLKIPGSAEGLKKFAGIIKLVGPLGDTMVYHFKDEFIVGKAGITISPTKMNVFYIGVDNPVEISVPGGPERVIPTISTGTIRPDGKGWMVTGLPRSGHEALISVSAVFAGKTKNMGSMKFRLKPVPDPVVRVGGKSEGYISKSILLASPYVTCEMPVGFDFDIKYTVTSFTFVTDVSGDIIPFKVSAGNRFTPEIMKILEKAGRNKRFWIEQVSVKGPDERTVTGVALKIN